MTTDAAAIERAGEALDEARRYGAREGGRRGAIAALAAGILLLAVTAADHLRLGLVAIGPPLALGLAQTRLVRWTRFAPDERLPPAIHALVALGAISGMILLGVLLDRTDLLPMAGTATIGLLLLVQSLRRRDAPLAGLGAAVAAAGLAGALVGPDAALLVRGAWLVLAGALVLVSFGRLARPHG